MIFLLSEFRVLGRRFSRFSFSKVIISRLGLVLTDATRSLLTPNSDLLPVSTAFFYSSITPSNFNCDESVEFSLFSWLLLSETSVG